MMKKKTLAELFRPLLAVLANLAYAYIVYFIARTAFLIENRGLYADTLTSGHLLELFRGGLYFDTSAILYTNALWALMVLFPLQPRQAKTWNTVCRTLFVTVNILALAVNLIDAVYFRFSVRRTTTTVFQEFQNENNLGDIFLAESLSHWYFFLLAAIAGYGLWRLYVPTLQKSAVRHLWLARLVSLLLFVPFCVAGMRGGWTTAVRPITISNANQYAGNPIEAALVLNTPFSLIRTIGKDVFVVPEYYHDRQEMAHVYNPVHSPSDSVPMTKKNVVILIVESFGREYIGALNKTLENGRYQGYTPCVDSLVAKSVTFSHSYCNGRKSIDGMPSILSSIPMFVEPFFLTPASMNHVSGIASILAAEGYQTAFFHGAQRGSMGFQAFSRATGFQEYYGREDYESDPYFGGESDFDGMWAIWDEPFLLYYAAKMNKMQQPFMTAVFTASSHHPYHVPEKYKDVFPEEGMEIHKCIRYTDMAIGRFFETVRKQPWFENTIFVLTSDHTNQTDHPYYETALGGFCSPIIIYESGRKPEMQDKIAQQIDILPTVLGMLKYQKPYFAFGIDVLNTPAEDTWAVNYLNGIYQYVKYGHVLQFDGECTKAVYSLADSLMQHNKKGNFPQQHQMEHELKAIIQQYMERMTQNRMKAD